MRTLTSSGAAVQPPPHPIISATCKSSQNPIPPNCTAANCKSSQIKSNHFFQPLTDDDIIASAGLESECAYEGLDLASTNDDRHTRCHNSRRNYQHRGGSQTGTACHAAAVALTYLQVGHVHSLTHLRPPKHTSRWQPAGPVPHRSRRGACWDSRCCNSRCCNSRCSDSRCSDSRCSDSRCCDSRGRGRWFRGRDVSALRPQTTDLRPHHQLSALSPHPPLQPHPPPHSHHSPSLSSSPSPSTRTLHPHPHPSDRGREIGDNFCQPTNFA